MNDPSEFLTTSSPFSSPSTTTKTNGTSRTATNKNSKSRSKASKVQKKTTKKSKPQEEYEPFDHRKRSRLESLAREEEDLLRSIALLKRRVPSSVATSFASSFSHQQAVDKEALEKAKQRVVEEGVWAGRKALEGLLPFASEENGGGLGQNDGGNNKMERQEGIEDGFGKAVEALRRLKSQMPATVARMERARVAGGYVVAGVSGAAPGEGR